MYWLGVANSASTKGETLRYHMEIATSHPYHILSMYVVSILSIVGRPYFHTGVMLFSRLYFTAGNFNNYTCAFSVDLSMSIVSPIGDRYYV